MCVCVCIFSLSLKLNNKRKQYRLIAMHRYHNDELIEIYCLRWFSRSAHRQTKLSTDLDSHSHRIITEAVLWMRKRFKFHFFFMGNTVERHTYLHHLNNRCDFYRAKTFNRRKFNFIRSYNSFLCGVTFFSVYSLFQKDTTKNRMKDI